MLIDTNYGHISDLVKDQFPAFYKKHGPNFIQFIQAYYEWMESPENTIGRARNLYNQFDIDTAGEEFLKHYKEKYMWGLPPELLGNQRLLQKHILELYRSKGSQQATRLLFRLLFNEDIDFYIPSYDIFKLSDNTWIQPRYLEVTYSPNFNLLVGEQITGADSGATALVESYESRFVNEQAVYLLLISNEFGEFKVGEKVIGGGIDILSAPVIKGSVVGIDVVGSSAGLEVGDIMTSLTGEKPVKVVVNEIYDGTGSLIFTVEKPGTYYTLDAEMIYDTGHHEDIITDDAGDIDAPIYTWLTKLPDANVNSIIGRSIWTSRMDDNILAPDQVVSGAGAEIKILSLKDTHTFQYNDDYVRDYLDIALDGIYPFPKLPTSNVATILDNSLELNTKIVGSIDQILVINPGVNYSSNVYIRPIDPYTSTSGIRDANGEFVGMNALIIGEPIIGDNIVKSVRIYSSGYNNINERQIAFIADHDESLSMTGMPIVGGVGTDVGYYDNTKSFLSDDKYLFDGHYYQDFSYVIKSARTLDKYIEILKSLVHPAGNAVYGDIEIRDTVELYNQDIFARVVIRDL